jgi:hypothetical protein
MNISQFLVDLNKLIADVEAAVQPAEDVVLATLIADVKALISDLT